MDRPENVKVEAVGANIKIYIDGDVTPVINYTDTTAPIVTSAGYIGYRTLSSAWEFDNLKVSAPATTDRGWNIDNVNISKETYGSLPTDTVGSPTNGWSQVITSGTAKWQAVDSWMAMPLHPAQLTVSGLGSKATALIIM